MSTKAKALGAAAFLIAAGGGGYAYFLYGIGDKPTYYQGYVEGESIRIAAPVAATLMKLAVRRGETVAAGAPLFELDRTAEQAALAEARAALRYAEAQYRRQKDLITTKATPAEKLDAARNAFEQAEAAVARAERRFAEMAPAAPAAALVEDTMALPGDFVPAGTPIVSLLPPDRIKLRFFVPETALATTLRGRIVPFRCDGCPAGLKARITYVSPRAEYTPPVIYSVGSREKLVFMIEAQPIDPPFALKPGQPVDVGKPEPSAADPAPGAGKEGAARAER
ncbi:MAG: HlyD family efflux transporter periplasmic adaptor subunit [Rhodospirillaceae bacterium]|nr:HlyD family efflux transporter periplasmic adaptor subunit [Rhodospirillaceae bacterium]